MSNRLTGPILLALALLGGGTLLRAAGAGAQDPPPRPPGPAYQYRGPTVLQDPADPLQSLSWTLGYTLPSRNRLHPGRRPITTRTDYDVQGHRIVRTYQSGTREVLPPMAYNPGSYAPMAFQQNFRQGWMQDSRTVVQESAAAAGTNQGLINLELPFQLPFTEKVFGQGAPNLRVSGSEQITLSGTSSVVVGQVTGERGGASLFPKLEMRQRLNVNLQGTIGSKLSINVAQNSDALTPLENSIQIRYRGEEDEILKSVDLGNTSLSLPPTQFISFSTRQEGLFGAKAEAQVGNLGMTMIASRQQSEQGTSSYRGGNSETGRTIRDWEYVKGKYFYLVDPDSSAPLIIDELYVYLDDVNTNNDYEALPARAWLDPDQRDPGDPFYLGSFTLLTQGENDDYYLRTYDALPKDRQVLVLRVPVTQNQVLAVAYTGTINGQPVSVGTLNPSEGDTLNLQVLRPNNTMWGTENLTQSVWAPVRNLEIKTVYNLGARDIDLSTFDLLIRQDLAGTGGDNPTVIKNQFGKTTPLIQALGLDQRNNASASNTEPDGEVDPEYIYPDEGIIIFPDSRPFDPDSVDIAGNQFRARSWPILETQSRPDTLGWYLGPGNTPVMSPPSVRAAEVAPGIYDTRPDVLSRKWAESSLYYLETTVRARQSIIQLNAIGGILEGSETVRLNGRQLARGTDYTIFYDSGEVTLLNPDATAPDADLQITYSYDSPFARGQRSLVGASLATLPDPTSNYSFATTWLHESNNVPDRRPRLGGEPSKTTVGDFSGRLQFQPWALTRFANGIPGVSAQAPSSLELQGAIGVSLPNPNTKGQVFLDDMEGTSVSVSPGVSRSLWYYTSVPLADGEGAPPPGAMPPTTTYSPAAGQRGRMLWFSPNTATVADINPGETNPTEREQIVPVLETIYIPQAGGSVDSSWGGLVAPISITGLDVSTAQYIEVWLNDYQPPGLGRQGQLVIDVGSVSEDAVWDALIPPAGPNGQLDYEDQNRSGGQIEDAEDTGLDLVKDAGEDPAPVQQQGKQVFGYQTAPPDWSGDDRKPQINTNAPEATVSQRVEKYLGINGTEDSRTADSEDLNANYILDRDNDYFQYVIDLADTPPRIDNGDGWRQYRIPLDEFTLQFGTPNLTLARHIRFWMRGIAPGDTLDLQIASIELVGNRWELSAQNEPGDLEQFQVEVVSNKDTEGYIPPFEVETLNNVTEREQSVSFVYENFQPDQEFSAFRRLFEARDYTLYQSVAFYLNPRMDVVDETEFFLRLVSDGQSDTVNYYELATTISDSDVRRGAGGWISIDVPVSDMSGLKISPLIPDTVLVQPTTYLFGPGDQPGTYPINPRAQIGDGLSVTVRGSPSFSRIRRLNAGLRNKSGKVLFEGEVWFNELRMGNVRRDKGYAGQGTVIFRMSDVLSLSGTIDVTNADFLRLGDRIGSGNDTRRYDLAGQIGLHKFLEPLQLRAPLDVRLSNTRQTPKFRPNSDLLFVGDTQARAISYRDTRSLSLSLAREPRGRGSFLTRYTIDALRATGNIARDYNLNITQADTTYRKGGTLNYNLGFSEIRPIRLLRKLDLYPWPRSMSVNLSGSQVERHVWTPIDAAADTFSLTTNTFTRTGVLNFNVGFQPLRILTYNYSVSRDLIDAHFITSNPLIAAQRQPTVVGGIDLGRMTAKSQNVAVQYTPPVLGFLRPRLQWTSGSTKSIDPNLTREDYTHVASDLKNNNSAGLSFTVPLGEFLEGKLAPSGGRRAPPPRDPQDGRNPRYPRRGRGAEPDTTEGDEGGTREQLYSFFTGVVRFRDIQLSSNFGKTSAYSRIYGEVPPAYELGFTRDIGLDQTVFPVEGAPFNQTVGSSNQYRGNTTVNLLRSIGVDFAYQKRNDKTDSNGIDRVSSETTWPDLRITWGDLSSRMPLIRNLFQDFRIVNTSYRLVSRTAGTEVNPQETVGKQVNWQPLLSVQGTFRNGWRVDLNVNLTKQQTETNRTGGAKTRSETTTSNYNVGAAKSFSRGQGSRDIDFKVNLIWTQNNRVNASSLGLAQEDKREDIRVNTSASTRFTRAMSGTFGLEVGQERRPVVNWTRRSIRLYFSTGFTF